MKLLVSNDLGINYKVDSIGTSLDSLVETGKRLAGPTGVAVRWVVVDDADQVVESCSVMSAQVRMINENKAEMMVTDDLYMKQLVERHTQAVALTAEEFCAKEFGETH